MGLQVMPPGIREFLCYLRFSSLTHYGFVSSIRGDGANPAAPRAPVRFAGLRENAMARPRHEHPTPGELEILQVLWERGPCTVREVMEALAPGRHRAYTTVMSLMNVMFDKGLVKRQPRGRAFVYRPVETRKKTLSAMVGDLLGRAFDGSAAAMVTHLLEEAKLSEDELDEIGEAIDAHRRERGER